MIANHHEMLWQNDGLWWPLLAIDGFETMVLLSLENPQLPASQLRRHLPQPAAAPLRAAWKAWQRWVMAHWWLNGSNWLALIKTRGIQLDRREIRWDKHATTQWPLIIDASSCEPPLFPGAAAPRTRNTKSISTSGTNQPLARCFPLSDAAGVGAPKYRVNRSCCALVLWGHGVACYKCGITTIINIVIVVVPICYKYNSGYINSMVQAYNGV